MRFHGISSPGSRSGRSSVTEEPVSRLIEEKIFVAVDKHVAKSKSTLVWALQNTGGKKICVIHVHQPSQMIPVSKYPYTLSVCFCLNKASLFCGMNKVGAKFPVSSVKEEEVRVFREKEREKVHMILDEYLRICHQRGVRAEKMFIETESIENGIVQLISELGIKKLVMGAAADRHHSKKMTELKSRKAIFVRREAPAPCQIWFTCKGYLIHTREAADDSGSEYASPRPSISASDLLQAFSNNTSRVHSNGSSTEHSERVSNGSLNNTTDDEEREFDGRGVRGSATVMSTVDENSGRSSPSNFPDGVDDSFHDKIRQVTSEAQSSRREAFAETVRRQKAEKNALDAIKRVKQSETAYSEVLKRRKDTEIAVAKEKERFVTIKKEQEAVTEEVQSATAQKGILWNQIAEADGTLLKLNQKLDIAVKLLQKLKDEREELQTERDRALREAEELRRTRAAETSTLQQLPQYFTDFSFSEIEEATNRFDSTLKIGEGGYGSIYVGTLRHTQVAIKMLNPKSSQGPVEYQQEVDVLSKMRHPNIITLIGACPEGWSLVYEYLPDGSLEDRLTCKDNSPPLSWQNRVRIATEICAALVFLHSNKAHSLVHGDLKPANILLDANLVSKLSDFGTCSILHSSGSKSDVTGTVAYLDPEASSSGELTPKSDVYSFGIVLLRLLTGRPALRIANEVKYALDSGTINNLLDPVAGDWPFVQAEQLARLALRCCEAVGENRPDLATEVWRVLEPMRASSGGSSSFHLGRNEKRIAPPYFICPIFQEVMQDPHVAADGFTYEAEAIRAWLDSGHDTSPMTNVKLSHNSLIPNHALRSAVQEWLQHHC
ncbi:hypothetical protein Bca4012_081390 [Brassica carinata]